MQKEYITDETWGKMLNIFKKIKGIYIGEGRGLRKFVNGVFYVLRTGAQWREIPESYGKSNSIFSRFARWSKKGIWEAFFEHCIEDPDLEYVMIDSTVIRAHACAAGYGKNSQQKEALGRSRGGYTTKIHAMVDALGNPLKFILTPGQSNDIPQAKNLLGDISNCSVIADRGYDCDDIRAELALKQCKSVIPGRNNRKITISYDCDLYKERHLIEFLFSKLKYFRRISSRYDKSRQNYLSFLFLAGACLWLR